MAWRNADAWGEGDTIHGDGARAAEPAGPSGSRDAAPRAAAAHPSNILRAVLAQAVSVAPQQAGRVPPLRALVLGFLGRHVDSLVLQLGPHLGHLPADVKACLLCVARRRGVLSNRMLLALADEGWTLMDLAGATALTERAVRHALLRCPRLRALDLTGLPSPSPALLRELPELCPSLELLAVGECKAQETAMLEVLPELLPHMQARGHQADAVQDSWEDAVQGDGSSLSDPGVPCGLQRLKLLVWPNHPTLAQHIVRTVNPRVSVVDSLPPHAHGGYGSGDCRAGPTGALRPRSPSPPAVSLPAAAGCLGGGSGRLKGASATASGVPGCGSQPGIQVIRVRKPEGAVAEAQLGARPAATTGRGGPNSGGGGGGVGRYTAPHLRQQHRQSPPGAAAVAGGLAAAAAGPGAGAAGGSLGEAGPRRAEGLNAAVRPGLALLAQGPSPHLQPHPQPHQQSHPQRHQQQQQQQQQQSAGSSCGRPQLDDCLAALVAGEAWEGLGGGASEGEREEELHIAEKFRRAYEEQDARLRAKALREAVAAERYEMRTSGAARALAHWLDQE